MRNDQPRNPRRAGDLDTSFGTAGTVSLEIARDAEVIIHDPINKTTIGAIPGIGEFVLFRLLGDGKLDEKFGSEGTGMVKGRFGNTNTFQRPTLLRLLKNGSLFVAGESQGNTQLPGQPGAALFTSDGQPDPNFGTEGRVLITLTPPTAATPPTTSPKPTTQQADYLFAYRGTGAAVGCGIIISLTNNGELASDFGFGGHTWFKYRDADVYFEALAIVKSGESIVALGSSMGKPFVASFNQQGVLNTSFGDSGVRLIEDLESGRFRALALGADDSLYCVGNAQNSGLVVALTASGENKGKFNSGAPLLISAPEGLSLKSAEIGLDNLLVTGGNLGTSFSGIYRIDETGTLDKDFGEAGAITRFGLRLSSLRLQADSNIIVAGTDEQYAILKRFVGGLQAVIGTPS